MKKFKVIVICIVYIIISSTAPTLNKWLYVKENFSNLTLSFLQCLSTFIGLHLCEKLDLFCVKSVHIDVILVPATLYCCFFTVMNMSLASNSLATYHIAKTMFVPLRILIQSLLMLKLRLKLLHISWGLIITGALILIYYDTNFDKHGIVLLSIGFVFYALYKMTLKRKQAELQMNKLQLYYYFSLISSIILCIGIPFVGVPMELLTIQWTYTKFGLIVLSNILAFVRVTSFYWISKVISNRRISLFLVYLWICSSILQGWYLFNEGLTLNQLLGLGVQIIGTVYCDDTVVQTMANTKVQASSTLGKMSI